MKVMNEAKEYNILEKAVQMEMDFVMYVDVATEEFHTIITDSHCSALPQATGKYSEMLAKDIPMYFHPDDQQMCARMFELSYIKKELEQRGHFLLVYRMLSNDVQLRKETKVYYQDESQDTLVFVRRDVTEAYREEEAQKDRLYRAMMETKQANEAKNEFLIRMSHEIRTPMNSIIGLSYLSRENINNSKQVLENLKKIEYSANFLRSFIDDILNLSQIESGNIALHESDIGFMEFLDCLIHTTEQKAGEKGIHFVAEKRGEFSGQYHFDADNLGKAIGNVLQNAVRFTQAGGQVVFITELLSENEEGAGIRFEVRDTGIGMDKNFLPHIYEPFAQEDKGTTTLYGGTGLGLSITKNIIGMMDGRIDVYSEKEKGSTFVITVQLATVEGAKQRRGRGGNDLDRDYDFSGRRILLVEDNEINIEITRNILEHKHFEVDVAVDGRKGLDAFLSHDAGYYDAILMDIRMPNMDGLMATRAIRESSHPDHSRIPIIAMTANAFEEDVRKSFEAGMDAHLSKPVDIRQMYQTLENVIYG
jgi:signal transduction histidine kinase/ActR/RegA family two-component response regulator